MTDMMAEAAHVTKEAAKKAVKKVKKVAKKVMPKKSAKKKAVKKTTKRRSRNAKSALVVLQLCCLHGMLSWEAYAVECEDQARGFLCRASDRVLRQV